MRFGVCIGTDMSCLSKLQEYGYDYAEINLSGIANWTEEQVEDARREMQVITAAVSEIVDLATQALTEENLEIAKQVEPLEQIIDKLKHKIKNNHINRLRDGSCTVEMGFILSDLLTNCERVADHCSNIAVCMIQIHDNSFDTHSYISDLKATNNEEFRKKFTVFSEKYMLPDAKKSD